ncbi:beta strand repeat-containing protein [Novipirellula maiorica]|uniref:beta strand repeat-containing protein n=1 Tax=Novipirellula maiorica TaxID=1265734 RepID=UPI001181910D|nr:hypothetical protein [Rhodopirellula maiorica]
MTANLNLLGSGLMIYGGSGVNNDLNISFDGVEYTFADPAEPINAIGGLAGLDTNPDPNIVTFDPSAIVGPFTQIVVNHNAGDDVTTIDSFRDGLAGGEGLDIRDDAGEGNDTVDINGDIGSALNPVNNTVLIRGEEINLGADIYTNNLDVVFANDVDLTADVFVDAGNGTAEFDADIDGTFALEIDAESIQIAGDVGGTTPLTSVDLNAGDQIQISGSTSATGNIVLTAATETLLGGDVLAGSGGAGSVELNGPTVTFNNPGAVQVSSSGAPTDSVSFGGIISSGVGTDLTIAAGLGTASSGGAAGLGNFNITSADTVDLNGVIGAEDIEINATTSLNAQGFQASAGDVDISTPATIFDGPTSTLVRATGTIDFSGTITGNLDDLLFRNATSLSIAGVVTDVELFDARRGGGLRFTDISVNSVDASDIIIEADNSTILLFGDLISAGDVTLIGRVEVFADIVIASGGAIGDNINIFGSVHDPANGARTLIIDAGAGAAQNLPLPPDVGIGVGGMQFLNVQVTGGIVSVSDIVVANDIIIEGGATNLHGPLSGSGDMIFRPRVVGGTLNIFNGATAPSVPDMTLTGDDLAFVVPGFANVVFGGPTAGAVFLFPDNNPNPITGAFNTIANTRFEAPLVVINEVINQGADPVLFVVDQLDLNMGGTFVGTADVNIEDFGAIGTITVNGALNQPVASLAAGTINVNVNAPASTVMFTGSIGHRVNDLVVDVALATFPAPTAIDVTGNVTATGDVAINGGIFSSTGSVNVDGNLDLLGNTTLRIPAGQDFAVGGDVIGNGNNLVIRGRGGAINLVDVLGDVIGVGQFKVDSSGANTATTIALENVMADDILLRGNDILIEGILNATAGNLHLIGAVSIFGNTDLLNTSGVATNFVRVDGTIDDASIGGADLNIDSGSGVTVLTGAVGSLSPVNNMSVASEQINFLTTSVTVLNDFSWIVGTLGNGINDRLFVVGGGSITAGNDILLEADQLVGDNVGVNLLAPTITLIERGIGD